VSSRTYRIYCLDGSGRIARGEWIEANHDEEAKLIALQSAPDAHRELWEGRRLLASLPANPLSA
jgi:hypothetical protein